MSLLYQWKKNDEDIVGAVEEVLPWQEDFKKGDYISVEIVPFDGEDEGIWRSEEGFTIPNSPPKIVSQPEFQKRHMFSRGLSPVLNTPEEFAKTLAAEKRLGPEVVQASGLYPDLKF